MTDVDVDRIRRVGVVGTGVMGTGIAQVVARHGFTVVLVGRDRTHANQARRDIEATVRRLAGEGKLPTAGVDELLARIRSEEGLEGLRDVDLVIEAVPEDVDLKQRVFSDLDRRVPSDAVVASNTSTIPITLLAAAISRPSRVLGMHFFNPAPVIEGVELVRGRLTSDETLTLGRAFVERLGKKPVVARDFAGFITSRLINLYLNEAARSVMDGNSPADVDAAMVHCLRMPMGPCALMDLIGIDVVLGCLETLHQEFGERFQPAPLLRQMARAGQLGRKTAQGFYSYEGVSSATGAEPSGRAEPVESR